MLSTSAIVAATIAAFAAHHDPKGSPYASAAAALLGCDIADLPDDLSPEIEEAAEQIAADTSGAAH